MDETKQKFLDKMHPPKAEEQIVSYRKWMLYLFLCAIPIVNIIFLLVFATSKDPSMITMKIVWDIESPFSHDYDEKFCEGSLHMDFN